jgi:hypothetical protein
MPTKKVLEAEWKKENRNRKKEGKPSLTFDEWYKQRFGTESPSFIAENSTKQSIDEFILSKLGMEPNAWGSRRRWHFLRIMAKHFYEVNRTAFDQFFVWATRRCQCMKMRTLRDDYLDTLERLGMIRIDANTGFIFWSGETFG